MDEKNAKGLENLTDEQVEAIAGGWIVDMGETDGSRYVIVEDISGEVLGQASDFNDARNIAKSLTSQGERAGKAMITPEEYEKFFGKQLSI